MEREEVSHILVAHKFPLPCLLPSFLAENEPTLAGLARLISKGFASADGKFTALAEDIADLRKDMATKDDVREIVREELAPIHGELKSIRRELDDLKEEFDNVSGFRKEIDHALGRIAAIEKHLGINKKIAADR
jgi:septal ring factor EnvC (AmiA/AmiB activator)